MGNLKDLEHKYTLGKKLGEGAFGIVWIATSNFDGSTCAVKKIKVSGGTKEEFKEFQQEAGLMRKCDHPNIIKYLETYQEGKDFYMVMELSPLGTLDSYVRKLKGIKMEQRAA